MPDDFTPWRRDRARRGAFGVSPRPPMTNPDTMAAAKARCHMVTTNTGDRRCGRCKILIDHEDDTGEFSCPRGLDGHKPSVP
jgi:hypothetical protein